MIIVATQVGNGVRVETDHGAFITPGILVDFTSTTVTIRFQNSMTGKVINDKGTQIRSIRFSS